MPVEFLSPREQLYNESHFEKAYNGLLTLKVVMGYYITSYDCSAVAVSLSCTVS